MLVKWTKNHQTKHQTPALINKLGFFFFKNSTKSLQTLAIGEDSHAVDVVCVTVVDLHTFARHLPPSDTRVVAAREELGAADHS